MSKKLLPSRSTIERKKLKSLIDSNNSNRNNSTQKTKVIKIKIIIVTTISLEIRIIHNNNLIISKALHITKIII